MSPAMHRFGSGIMPQPVLVRVNKSSDYCSDGSNDKLDYGAFELVDDWELTDGCQGVIVQEVKRQLEIRWKDDNSAVERRVISTWEAPRSRFYICDMHYWECFPVSAAATANGVTAVQQHALIEADRFGTGAFRPPTKAEIKNRKGVSGVYQMTGVACFYPTQETDRTKLGFGVNGDDLKIAGGLMSTAKDPSAHLALLVLNKAGISNTVTRTVVSKWDSTIKEGNSFTEVT
jgi:hypothetical protein